MQTLETMKSRSQASFSTLVEKAKEQPDGVKIWGVTAGSAAAGAVTMTAVAGGLLAIATTLAAPPIALTVGAVGGGLWGWNYMRGRQAADQGETLSETVPATETSSGAEPDTVAETVVTEIVVEPVATSAEVVPGGESIVDAASEQLEASPPTLPTLPTAPAAVTAGTLAPEIPDNLEAISGIGPVYASSLRTAGIQTFAQLAELTPERVQEIIGPIRSGHMIEADLWIDAARQLATPSEGYTSSA